MAAISPCPVALPPQYETRPVLGFYGSPRPGTTWQGCGASLGDRSRSVPRACKPISAPGSSVSYEIRTRGGLSGRSLTRGRVSLSREMNTSGERIGASALGINGEGRVLVKELLGQRLRGSNAAGSITKSADTRRQNIPPAVQATMAPPRPSSNAPGEDFLVRESEEEGEQGEKKFVWEQNWYPVSLLEDLDPSRPTPFQLLGIDLVLWRDESGRWRAMKDSCPHRLAPLSEGRLDKNGLLQCSYHGWAFRGDGSCAVIPQAAAQGPEARAHQSPRACAVPFPTLESQGLLFVWPDPQGWEEALSTEPTKLPAVFEDPRYGTVTIQRDLNYGYDTLMENVSDPSHIDFAHHKVTGRRDRARPLPFQVEESGVQGFRGSADGNPRLVSDFEAPCYFGTKIELKVPLPLLGEQAWEIWICSFNVPMAPGKTRSIVCSARNFSKLTVPGPGWWQLYPRWLEHLTSNKVYDGDMIVLQGQEKALLRGTSQGGRNPSDEYGKMTFTPTGADRFVLAFRNWLRRHGGGEPAWAPGVKQTGAPLPSTVLSKHEMLDRLSQHTQVCSSCRGALQGIRTWTAGLATLTLFLLAAAALPTDLSQRALLAGAALLTAGAAGYLKFGLEPQFIFVDYVHSDIPD